MRDRRSDYDVTNTVRVSSPSAVSAAVYDIWHRLYPDADYAPVAGAFDALTAAFIGKAPGLHGIETTYHDLQHTLDVTLAMMRLIDGYESDHSGKEKLGAERAATGVITALFHDAGYLRRERDNKHHHGAEYTRVHVSRSAEMLRTLLPRLGLGNDAAEASAEIVHFTGYEKPFDQIKVNDPKWRTVGHLLGTADMLAQMADRCYLEKCRDRLYEEFVMGGMAKIRAPDGRIIVNYESPQHLLKRTPEFCEATIRDRLGTKFDRAYRYFDIHFSGENLYMKEVRNNLAHLKRVIETNRWDLLRRKPACYNITFFQNNQVAAPSVRH